MEEEQNQQPAAENPTPKPVQTPPQPMKKDGGGKRWLILIIVVLLIAAGIYLIVRGITGSSSVQPSPTPSFAPIETPTPSPSSEPVDKSSVSIDVLNGTGIANEASYLQGKLADLGYTDIKVGNADSQDNSTTTVTFSSTLGSSVVDEITKELEDIYQDVNVNTSRTQTDFDVVIVSGLRKGQTPKPSPTATPEPTESPSPSPSASSSPSSSPTQ